jgi:tetratricopeptide (TPR) repeat protein
VKHVITLFVVTLLCISAAACSDPEVAKRKHLAKGDALMAEGKPAEAILEYRNAIRIDRRFGEARFKLAAAQSSTGNLQDAAKEYVRAADLLPERSDAQLQAASIMIAQKQFEVALKYADNALAAEPTLVDAHLVRAYALAGQSDTESAIRELETAMVDAPLDARLHTSLGGLRASAGNAAEAEKSFRKAIEIDPKSIPAHLALAHYLWSSTKTDEAEQAINQAIALEPNGISANRMLAIFLIARNRSSEAEAPLLRLVNAKDDAAAFTLADLYSRTGRQDQARALYGSLKDNKRIRATAVARLAALEYATGRRGHAHDIVDAEFKANPDTHSLLIMKARWLAAEGKGSEALEVAKKAMAVLPNSADSHYVLGLAHGARGENDDAIASYKEALRLNPRLAAADLQLSRLLLQSGETDQALQHASAARKANPRNPEARFNLAQALAGKNDLAGAEAELKTLRQEFSGSSGVYSLSGQILQARGDRAGARREFDRALQLDPTDMPALRAVVRSDLELKKTDAARARLEAALEKQPNRAALLILAAQFEHAAGNMGPAEAHLLKAVEAEPTNGEAYNKLALFYVDQKKLDVAKQRLREYAKQKPDSIPTLTMIGMIEQSQGREDDAIKVYEEIVKDNARAPIAANNLAYLYAERGVQLDMAVQLAQSAKQQLPDNPDVSDTLGWAYVKKGMVDLAIPPLEFSLTKAPNNVGYLFHLGMAYAKAGRAEQARETLNRALQLEPGFTGAAEARQALAALQK